MSKRQTNESDYETDKELNSIKAHMDKQDKSIQALTDNVQEIKFLLSGSVMGKTKGLVQLVDEISTSLENMVGQFLHAEKWRRDFKAAQADNAERNEKKEKYQSSGNMRPS